jgi:hypothetical protein
MLSQGEPPGRAVASIFDLPEESVYLSLGNDIIMVVLQSA